MSPDYLHGSHAGLPGWIRVRKSWLYLLNFSDGYEDIPKLNCDQCTEQFLTKTSLDQHLSNVHSAEAMLTHSNLFCDRCDNEGIHLFLSLTLWHTIWATKLKGWNINCRSHLSHRYTVGRKNGIIEILVNINQLFVAKIDHYIRQFLPPQKNGLIDRGYQFLFVQWSE